MKTLTKKLKPSLWLAIGFNCLVFILITTSGIAQPPNLPDSPDQSPIAHGFAFLAIMAGIFAYRRFFSNRK